MKLIKQLIFALFVGSSALAGSGCSVLGFGIGALADSKSIKTMGVPGEELTPIPKNSPIQILLKNGQQQEGNFQFYMERRTGDEYAEYIVWYDKVTDRQVSTKIADIEQIVAKAKQQQNGKWIGLGIGGLIDAIMVVGAPNSVNISFF